MSDLKAVQDKPEARQFYRSILEYMESPAFAPSYSLSVKDLQDLFTAKVKTGEMKKLFNSVIGVSDYIITDADYRISRHLKKNYSG